MPRASSTTSGRILQPGVKLATSAESRRHVAALLLGLAAASATPPSPPAPPQSRIRTCRDARYAKVRSQDVATRAYTGALVRCSTALRSFAAKTQDTSVPAVSASCVDRPYREPDDRRRRRRDRAKRGARMKPRFVRWARRRNSRLPARLFFHALLGNDAEALKRDFALSAAGSASNWQLQLETARQPPCAPYASDRGGRCGGGALPARAGDGDLSRSCWSMRWRQRSELPTRIRRQGQSPIMPRRET